MPIIAKSAKSFEPCPAGPQQAVCVDVVDLGMVTSTYVDEKGSPKLQHKIDIVWQSSEPMKDGKPYIAKKRYTLSLHEKATLRQDLESWRGKPFSESEAEGFDVEKLLGANCIINVAHKAGSKGGTFANVVSVMPLMRGQQRIEATPDYVRVCDRELARDSHDSNGADIAPNDDDIPFSFFVALIGAGSLALHSLASVLFA